MESSPFIKMDYDTAANYKVISATHSLNHPRPCMNHDSLLIMHDRDFLLLLKNKAQMHYKALNNILNHYIYQYRYTFYT